MRAGRNEGSIDESNLSCADKSRAGYVTTDRSVTLPGDALVSLDATLARSAP
jgi:hypothetical protein